MEALNKWITDNPFPVLVATLIIGAFIGDWLKAGYRIIVKRLSSRTLNRALKRISYLEQQVKEAKQYIDNPQNFNHFVWYKIFYVLTGVFVGLFLLCLSFLLPVTGSILYLITREGEIYDYINLFSFVYVVPMLIFLNAALQGFQLQDILTRVKDFDEYKNRVFKEIDELKQKYSLPPYQISQAKNP
jgi:hypothetical protein